MRARLSFLETIRFLLAMLFLSTSLLSIQSCRVEESSSGGGGGPGGGDSPDLGLTSFKVYAQSQDASYSIYATKDGDGETPCIPTEDDKDITCVIDMEELDLYIRGLTIKIDLPGEGSESDYQCNYLIEFPYFYRSYPASEITPSAIYIAETAAGLADPEVGVGDWDGWPFGGSADIYYVINGVPYAHADLYGSAATSSDELRCPWDYTKVGSVFEGPDCCIGIYSQFKATIGEGDEGVTEDITTQEWAGSFDNCFGGSGIKDYSPRTLNGYPLSLVTNVPLGGLTHEYTVSPPEEDRYLRQIHASNYFSGDLPDPLRDGNPYYIYGCLDHNQEFLYRINVQVREWNKSNELDKLIAGLSGDYDSRGCESTPFGMMPINDHADWVDYNWVIDQAGNPGLALSTYGFDISAVPPATPAIVDILNIGRSGEFLYTKDSRFLDSTSGTWWGIDSCP